MNFLFQKIVKLRLVWSGVILFMFVLRSCFFLVLFLYRVYFVLSLRVFFVFSLVGFMLYFLLVLRMVFQMWRVFLGFFFLFGFGWYGFVFLKQILKLFFFVQLFFERSIFMLLSLIFLVWNYQRLLMFMLKSFFVRFLVLGFWIENIVMLQVLFFILRFMLLNFLILCLMVLNQVLSFLKVFELQIIMQVLLFMLKMRVLFFMVFFLLRMSVQVLFIVGGLFMLLVVMYWRNFRVFLLWKMNLFMWEILKMLC